MSPDPALQRVSRTRAVANWLDSAFRIPGTNFRIGWDTVIGLLPGVGDVLTSAFSLWIVLEARNLGAPWYVIVPMLWNALLDLTIGAIPLIGDVFDAFYKANLRNVDRLERWLASQ